MKTVIDSPQSLAAIIVGVPKLTLQEKLLRAGFRSIETMSLAASGPFDTTLPEALTILASDKVL